ncbi:MAG: ribosome silencing factor [Victivallaceae bacterium]
MVESKKVDAEIIADLCAAEAAEKKAENIVTLKVTQLTTIADYFVLCTANSEPHLNAVMEGISRKAREVLEVRPISVNGTPASQWILLDFGAVLVHIMTPEMRDRYQLESLWGDAPKHEAVKKLEEMASSK